MRVIDDLVDDEFLKLEFKQRKIFRKSMNEDLKGWLKQVVNCASYSGPLNKEIIAALEYTVGRSDLDTTVWKNLANSLQMDINEIEMDTWSDFLRYCEGATVAPASIYIYLLAATYSKSKEFRYKLPKKITYYARDLAIYCYIIHIIRDLAKDAGQTSRLITIPNELLFDSGLTREEIKDAINIRSSSITILTKKLLEAAEKFYLAGHEVLAELNEFLDVKESASLNALIAIYDKLYKAACKNALSVVVKGPTMERQFRTKIS